MARNALLRLHQRSDLFGQAAFELIGWAYPEQVLHPTAALLQIPRAASWWCELPTQVEGRAVRWLIAFGSGGYFRHPSTPLLIVWKRNPSLAQNQAHRLLAQLGIVLFYYSNGRQPLGTVYLRFYSYHWRRKSGAKPRCGQDVGPGTAKF